LFFSGANASVSSSFKRTSSDARRIQIAKAAPPKNKKKKMNFRVGVPISRTPLRGYGTYADARPPRDPLRIQAKDERNLLAARR
jgi:hypothetical protein